MGVQYPPLSGRGYEGPDLNDAPLLEQALAELDTILNVLTDECRDEHAERYLDAWQRLCASMGISAHLMWEGCFPSLMVGLATDSQHEERTRRMGPLWDHLIRSGYRFQLLRRLVRAVGGLGTDPQRLSDEIARETLCAMRRFLETDGRILVDPSGNLGEGGGMPRRWGQSADFDEKILAAGRTYFSAIACPIPAAQIKAFVEQFGTRHENGWIELTAESPIFTDPEVAFAALRASYARIQASGDDGDDDADWAIIGLAEESITGAPSSLRVAEMLLWIGLVSSGLPQVHALEAQRGDLDALILAERNMDWSSWLMILAIKALRGAVSA